ncbi:MAG: extracellular medium-chain-length polyhydroxyalkanoate depolymerase, partial [Polyangiaceae bacterium]
GGPAGPAADAGQGRDSSASGDAPAGDDGPSSRCQISASSATCEHQSTTVSGRPVAYETPLGSPPASGWPAVVYFQGSFVPGTDAFAAASSAPFGQYDLTRTVAALLDDGYAIVAPDASSDGTSYWETNIPPYESSWAGCPDDVLMQALLAAVAAGGFGPIDPAHLYAMGISSGGFMTSRMAVSYPGEFRALVDHSGSYATCSATCAVPTPLPGGHPPTLFLHGDADQVVPLSAIQPYLDALTAEGHEAQLVTDPDAGHQWLPEGPQVIPAWFDAHP